MRQFITGLKAIQLICKEDTKNQGLRKSQLCHLLDKTVTIYTIYFLGDLRLDVFMALGL